MSISSQVPRRRVADWFGSDDVLADYPSPSLAQWYRRLAAYSEAHGGVLAPLLLRLWLDNRDPRAKKVIPPHSNLTGSAMVRDAIAYHRSVYLTEKKGHLAVGVERWAGAEDRRRRRPDSPSEPRRREDHPDLQEVPGPGHRSL
jgi:hypothetical protein